jgi:hypothetical protein
VQLIVPQTAHAHGDGQYRQSVSAAHRACCGGRLGSEEVNKGDDDAMFRAITCWDKAPLQCAQLLTANLLNVSIMLFLESAHSYLYQNVASIDRGCR